MSILARIDQHARLMSRMADRNGADLDLALQTAMVNPGELRGAILACTGCTQPEACEERLDCGETGIPDFCRNGDMIRSVARLMEHVD